MMGVRVRVGMKLEEGGGRRRISWTRGQKGKLRMDEIAQAAEGISPTDEENSSLGEAGVEARPTSSGVVGYHCSSGTARHEWEVARQNLVLLGMAKLSKREPAIGLATLVCTTKKWTVEQSRRQRDPPTGG